MSTRSEDSGPHGRPGGSRARAGSGGRPGSGSGPGEAPSDRSPWNWLLFVPLLVTLVPALYNSREPSLAGIPFFYWYQLAVIVVGVGCTLVVYAKTKG